MLRRSIIVYMRSYFALLNRKQQKTKQYTAVIVVHLAVHRSTTVLVYRVNTLLLVTYVQLVMDQPGKVANPARGQLNRENEYFPVRVSRLRIWSRETGSAVPSRVSLLISILRLNLVLTYRIPPEFRGGVHLFI